MISKIREIYQNKFIVFMLALFLMATILGGTLSAQEVELDEPVTEESLEESDYTKANAFQDIMFLLQNYYVEDVELDTLIEGAIEGMLNKVDRYSYFMTPKEFEEMQEEYEGKYGGIGIVITTRDNELTIVSPINNTPGERAGLQSGDVIKEIDGQDTSEMSQMKAADLMRGEEGTDVILKIKRGQEDPFEVELTREDIEVPYVESEMKTDQIGYISLAQFIENVGSDIEKELAELKEAGAQGIILDLRNNPGGILSESIDVASVFLEEGDIVSVRQRDETERILEVNQEMNSDSEIPLIVLINRGSASGSEIVAGAFQDYERATIMGTTSFGKGVVQSVIPLQDGSAVSLTTARYYTPKDNYIHELGIEPDIKVEFDADAAAEEIDNQLEAAIEEMQRILAERE
ncbi:carboxyl-terminal protease [Halanaerobium hydrogeniformans]|uniref:Carboxyl-terminal protease n=1 Tax=Halanaerobium hydrogeniformans TaxID=656519 RepID=E4RPR6_HALHG|nr:S41 family peptidase [Halanaerobium hydrogeniformans]ADQ13950.1 carboxyl-terminal protease [Halanaerobium hydrogeniformans]